MLTLLVLIPVALLCWAIGWVAGFLSGVRLKKEEIEIAEVKIKEYPLLRNYSGPAKVTVIPSERERREKMKEIGEEELLTPKQWRDQHR